MKTHRSILGLFGLGFFLRIIGIDFGLPGTFHADEPHHVNLAVYFGSGDLNPHIFKYPTLWMYFLSILYGVFYVFWSGFGLLRGVDEFARLFVWDPTPFYLIARGTSAILGAGAIIGVYILGRRLAGIRAALLAAGFLAVAPRLVYYSHLAKPDMLMLALSALAWWSCARVLQGERSLRDYLAAGALIGLACSTQYTAALLAPLLAWAHFLGNERSGQGVVASGIKFPALGYLAMAAAFFLGTPYALLDWATFTNDLRDIFSYAQGGLTGTPQRAGWAMAPYLLGVLGWSPFIGAAFLALGAWMMWRRDRRAALFLVLPVIAGSAALALQSRQAGSERYVAALYPAVTLLAAGLVKLTPASMPAWRRRLGLGFLLLPGIIASFSWNRQYLVPDTRTLAMRWIEQNVAPGAKLLLDQVHASPPLAMSRDQVRRLYERTSAIGHARARYYKVMLEGHPGAGYDIKRILLSSGELISMERHTQWSQQAYDLLDVEGGWPVLKQAGIEFVVLSSEGATPEKNPRLRKFFSDCFQYGDPVAEFRPGQKFAFSPNAPRSPPYAELQGTLDPSETGPRQQNLGGQQVHLAPLRSPPSQSFGGRSTRQRREPLLESPAYAAGPIIRIFRIP